MVITSLAFKCASAPSFQASLCIAGVVDSLFSARKLSATSVLYIAHPYRCDLHRARFTRRGLATAATSTIVSPNLTTTISAAKKGMMKEAANDEAEIKDPSVIFNTVWNKLESKYGMENMKFPQEIIWLGGAPGAGKGTNTPFIASVRGITAPPIVMSSLLQTPEAKSVKAQGGLVSDSYVVQLIMEELCKTSYRSGVVVDGYPRNNVQVECTNMLHEKMLELRKDRGHTFPRPVFRITVLFIEEKPSIERQLKRGAAIKEQNKHLAELGLPQLEERDTDNSEDSAQKRYKIFKDHYSTLVSLKQHFPFSLIDAGGSIDEVQANIINEFKYQSSLELSQESYDMVQRIPLVSDVIFHARGDLVARLDDYMFRHPKLFEDVIKMIEREFVPIIRRHSIAGIAIIRSESPLFRIPLAIEMALDVLSERGYHVMSDVRTLAIPDSIDLKSGKIVNLIKTEYLFQVRFQRAEIREAVQNAFVQRMQLRK